MKSGLGRALSWGGLLALGLLMAQGRAMAGNCVAYARAETGVALFGNAGGWWNEAAGVYQRGHVPEVGSILVFQRTGFMPAGHVAVVSKVIGPGQILVDQSNWYHGEVTHDTPVIDTSPDHDWTSVAVMNIGSMSAPSASRCSYRACGLANRGSAASSSWPAAVQNARNSSSCGAARNAHPSAVG